MMSGYTIKCWIPFAPEDDDGYATRQNAHTALTHRGFLHPKNVYTMEDADAEDDENEERGGLEGLTEK